MRNVIENDIKTGTSEKGYMTGFTGFANVVKNIRDKLKKQMDISEEFSVAVDIDYDQPISSQIESGLITVIKRTQKSIVHLMQTFGIMELSIFCGQIESIMDICRTYQISIEDPSFIEIVQNETQKKNVVNDEDLIQGLANLAMEIDSPSAANSEDIMECMPHDIFDNNIYDTF